MVRANARILAAANARTPSRPTDIPNETQRRWPTGSRADALVGVQGAKEITQAPCPPEARSRRPSGRQPERLDSSRLPALMTGWSGEVHCRRRKLRLFQPSRRTASPRFDGRFPTMLDPQFLCDNRELVEENCRNRGVSMDLGRLVELAGERRKLILKGDELRREQKRGLWTDPEGTGRPEGRARRPRQGAAGAGPAGGEGRRGGRNAASR